MLHPTRTRPALAVVLLLTLAAVTQGQPASQPTGDELTPRWRTVARWYGRFDEDVVRYASREPGLFGMALSGAHYHQVSRGNVVLREEVDDVIGLSRTVAESFSWDSSVDDLYYVNKDGSRVAAGAGARGGGSFSEAELAGPLVNDPGQVAAARAEFERAQDEVERCTREQAEAQRAADAANADGAGAGGAGAAAAAWVPSTQVGIDALDAQQKLQAILADPKATAAARDAAIRRSAETSQAYSEWMTRRAEEFQKKYVPEMERLMKVAQDPAATDAQRDEASRRLTVLSDEMEKDQKEIFGSPPPADTARDRLEEATAALESARAFLHHAARDLWYAENSRSARLNVNARLADDGDGRRRADASIHIEDRAIAQFDVGVTDLEIKSDVGGERMAVVLGEVKQRKFELAPHISGEAVADEHGAATITKTEQGGGGEDGLVGGSRYSRSFTLQRLPVKQQLVFRGKLYHRIRVPDGPFPPTHALILENGNPVSLAGAIPVAGSVRVEGRLYAPNELPPPALPPDFVGPPTAAGAQHGPPAPPVNVADSNNGEFELVMPLKSGQVARLTFIYHNPDAQVTEWVHVDVPIDSVTSAWGTIPGDSGQQSLPALERHAECWLRWQTAPRLSPLGSESRGATVQRANDWHVVRFEGFNAILINSFILQAPHLNQNKHTMEIAARVPAARLLAARPAFVPEARVRARLRVPTTGPVDEWTTAQVPVKGTVACFPCSMTMTLAGLGFINIPPGTVRTGEIQALAQAIYQWYSDRHASGRFGRGMPEIFPFPPDPSMADALATTIATTPIPAVRALANQMLEGLRPMYLTHWPYTDGDDDTMKWLISVRGETTRAVGAERVTVDVEAMRPWQWAWIVGYFVRDTYHGGDASKIAWYTTDPREHPEWSNVFAADPKKVAHVLGGGWGSVTSIKHLTEGGEGGHLIALVGAIIDSSGNVVRLIFHDPYGDQSRNPTIPGYYHLNRPVYNDRSKFDRDPPNPAHIPNPGGDSWGRYVPYGPDINSFQGSMTGKFWGLYAPKERMTPQLMAGRMLPSVSASSANSVPSGPTTAPDR